MTFLCLSTFLSLVFQPDAQSLLGEKRSEYLFCSTSEKWCPEPLTSTPLEKELNVTKESLISWGKLNRGWSQVHIWQLPFKLPRDLFSPAPSDSSHCWVPHRSVPPTAVAPTGSERKGPKSWRNVTVMPGQALHGQDWGKDALGLLLPNLSGHRCWFFYKILFPLPHDKFRFS